MEQGEADAFDPQRRRVDRERFQPRERYRRPSREQARLSGESQELEIEAAELIARLDSATLGAQLIDVREIPELTRGIIPGAIHLPMSSIDHRVAELSRETSVICYCEHGVRSLGVAEYLN